MLVQDNDVERATNLNRDHLDYVVEESWRWAMACGSCNPPCFLAVPTFILLCAVIHMLLP